MIAVLRNRAYAKLFSAQVVALIGTGLLTVALSLLAFDIAGEQAGVVLGTALTIKMFAYVAVSPVIAAAVAQVPRKGVLICADLIRASIALALPFVSETWQIYILIFALQAASATFTPAFQAVIPDVLPREEDYTRALSLSRLAYDLESVFSPMLAAALLAVTSYHNLFIGTVVGFLGSALLVAMTALPVAVPQESAPFLHRLTLGSRLFLGHRELRSLLAMNLVVAASTAMVIVNTVLLVRGHLDREQSDVALMFAAYDSGSMATALSAPRLLERTTDRRLMLTGTAAVPVVLLAGAGFLTSSPHQWTWSALCATWFALGAANSTVLTSAARLIRRTTTEAQRPAAFAAQFSLSHACFILTYPLAGALGSAAGLASTSLVLATVALLGALTAGALWRSTEKNGRRPLSAGNPSAKAG